MVGDGDRGEKLPDNVARALETLRPVPQPDPIVWQENRRSYIVAATALASSSQPEALHVTSPSLESHEPAQPQPGRGIPVAISEFLRLHTWRGVPVRAALIAGLALALFLGFSAGAVSAARESLPGSPLYGLKIKLEQWALGRARTPQAVSSQALAQSQVRVDEAARIVAAGDSVPIEVAARFQEQLALAVQATDALDEPQRIQAQSRISETLQHQIRTMAEITARVKGESSETVDHGAVAAMVQTMMETQAQLGPDLGQGLGEVGNPLQEGPATEEPGSPCGGPDCGNQQEPTEPGQGPGPGGSDAPGGDEGQPPDPGKGQNGNQGPEQNGPGPRSTPPAPNSQQTVPEQQLLALQPEDPMSRSSELPPAASLFPQRSGNAGNEVGSGGGSSR